MRFNKYKLIKDKKIHIHYCCHKIVTNIYVIIFQNHNFAMNNIIYINYINFDRHNDQAILSSAIRCLSLKQEKIVLTCVKIDATCARTLQCSS